MTIRRHLLPVLLALPWTGSLEAQRLQNNWASPCTLDVVLVTFKDTTGMHPGNPAVGDAADQFNYGAHDLPHGYTARDGRLSPGPTSYTMDDFKRLFTGGYGYSVNGEPLEEIPAFTGTGQIVAREGDSDSVTEPLPEVFGSLRDYYHVVSGGAYQLHVRILNMERGGYPVWVQVPHTKGYYAEERGVRRDPVTGVISRPSYWNDARTAIVDSIRAWDLDPPAAYDPPDHDDRTTWPRNRRLRRKVVYLHAGPEFHDHTDGDLNSLIHPRANSGYRYVAGERRGGGRDNHQADRFNSIGIHAHEFGHLLGFDHPGGHWRGTNRYTGQTTDQSAPASVRIDPFAFSVARTVAWGVMQGAEGPPVEGSANDSNTEAWTYEYYSCPHPPSAPDRRDLGWISSDPGSALPLDDIPGTTLDQSIVPGHFYSFQGPPGVRYILEFRDAEGFGQYAGWYRFTEAPGLLIWKTGGHFFHRLIPADNRRIYNAKLRTSNGNVRRTPRAFSSSFAYSWLDQLSDPFGAPASNNHRGTFQAMAYYQSGNSLPTTVALDSADLREQVTAADDGHFRVPNLINSRGNLMDPEPPSRRAVRNIRVTRDSFNPATGSAQVDVYFDHWVGPIAGMESWGPDSVYVGGDVTIESGASVTIANGTTVNFLAPIGTDVSDYPELIVSDGGMLTVGTGVTFGTVDRDGARTPTHGLRVETGGTATLNGVTIDEGEHRWSGLVTVGGDLIVGDGTNAATLRLEAGTEVRFAATDAESDGQDPGRVELIVENSGVLQAGAGNITFRSSNDPDDATNTDWYGIRVAASGIADLSGATIRDGRRCVQLRGASTVTLTNTTLTNCGLTVALTGIPPVLGGRITASLDPGDGSTLNEEFWQWQGRASATDDWESLRPSTGRRYPAEGTYIPRAGVRGHMLRATLRYRARFGGGSIVYNYAQSAPTAAVAAGPPGPLSNCTPSEGDRRVTIDCDPAEANGSPLLRNEYRQSTDGGVTWDPNRWVEIPPGTNPNTMSVDVSNLRNGTEYTFELRAVNAVGAGASVRVQATPGSGPGVPPQPTSGLTASPGGGTGINVGWGAVEATPAVTGYRVRSQWALVGTAAWSSYDTVATPGARTLRYPHRDYTNVVVKHRLRYQVQAVNASGAGAWSAAFPAGGLVPPPSGPPGLESMGVDARAVTMTWECPNNRWCEPLPGSTVAPMTLEAQGKTGGRAWGDDWEAVPTAQLTSVTHLVAALGRDQVHQFRTRAVNSEGAEGFASSAGAALPLRAEAGDGQVALSWDSPGYSRLSWQSRSKAGAGSWTRWQSVPDSEASTTSYNSSPMPGRRPPAAICWPSSRRCGPSPAGRRGADEQRGRRALRHGVLWRHTSFGSHSADGSRFPISLETERLPPPKTEIGREST